MNQETNEFSIELEKFSKLSNKIIYNETTPENPREIAKQANWMAEMLETED